MDTSTNRPLTPARIVALVVITALAVALVYLRLAPGEQAVSVPAGAKAGDLILHPCTYPTEDGDYSADCGTLVVPENRADPRSRLIAVPVTRIHAQSDRPAAPIFPLWGGPGLSNMDWPQASRFTADHDVVLVGYRGVDGSVRLDCPEVASAVKRSTDLLGKESFRAYGDAFGECADRLTDNGVDLAGYGLPQQVDDMEAVRAALGYDRIDLLSESAGTRTAIIYSWRYPKSVHRSVMVGVNPPGHMLWDPQTTDQQIDRYADLCATDPRCSRRTDDLAATMRRTSAHMPERWLFLPINQNNVRVLSFFGLMESTTDAPLAAPQTLDSWLSAAQGDTSGFWLMSLIGDFAPFPFVWGHYASAGMLDAQAAREYFAPGARGPVTNLGYVGSAFSWGGGHMADGWPEQPEENTYSRVRTSQVETLMISGELDPSTPPQVAAKELLPYLPNGHQVVLPRFGHTATFWAEQPDSGTALITTFFDTGRVDDSRYQPQHIDLAPSRTLPTLGKLVAGIMVGLPLLVLLSLVWMARHVRRQGSFGRKASASLRSLYPIVLGLGGWLLGVLIVITTMPGVPLDSELLAVAAVGVPIALGIYGAWVHRDWSARSKTTGVAAAVAGALVGAWLGFNATEGLLALPTAIVGGAVGANLVLIILDISRTTSARPWPPHGHSGRQLGALRHREGTAARQRSVGA